MKKIVSSVLFRAGILVLFFSLIGCEAGNLGFYFYPQAQETELAGTVGLSLNDPPPKGGLEVVGYLPSYKIGSVDPAQTRHLTDLVYFTLTPLGNGDFTRQVLTQEHLTFLRGVKRDYNVRILMGITDHNKNGALSKICRSVALQERFAQNLTEYLHDMNFDGADFDWEWPQSTDLSGYSSLLRLMQRQFAPYQLKLTVAVSPSHPLEKASFDAVDRVHGMLYDDYGRHSTLANSLAHIETMLSQGVEAAKLQLGVPFYGRGYTRRGPSWSSALSYKTLRERYSPDPDQDTVSGYYFNGIETIRQKVLYAQKKGLSGIMVWEIGQDTTDSTSLLSAISRARQNSMF